MEQQADRPDAAVPRAAILPSLSEVLAMPALAAGRPAVLAGAAGLDRPIRWVHVSEGPEIGRFLDGGELMLTTGARWARGGRGLVELVAEGAGAGLAALIIELGPHLPSIPDVVVDACEEHDLVLVALHREVRFTAVTEAVHRRILAAQTEALRAGQEVRTRFGGLILRGAPADHLVAELARMLAAPVVLESLGHQAVLVAGLGEERAAELEDWEARSRTAPTDWLTVPVEARGLRWGRLVALPGPAHPAGRRAVLEQGALALALGRLADGDADEWTRIGGQRLVDALLEGRFATAGPLESRLEAAGLPFRDRDLIGLVVRPLDDEAVVEIPDGARRIGGRAIAGRVGGDLVVLLSVPAGRALDDAAIGVLLAPAAARAGVPVARLSVSIGMRAGDVDGLLQSVREARDLLGPPGIHRVARRPLAGLVATFREDRRFQAHAERLLGPLLDHDLRHDGDLLLVLRALLRHPGNRTAAARDSHLSRSVFYQRLARIEELLGADLDDGELLAALHLAVLVKGH